jgi:integrase
MGVNKAMKFTRSAVEKLTLPVGKDDFTAWDSEVPNFGIRLRKGGSKRWVIYYRIGSEQRRESLGDYHTLDIDAARKAAKQRFSQLALGIDPKAEKVKAKAFSLTFAKVAEQYLDFKRDRLRPSSFEAAKLHLTAHWKALAGRPIADVKRADVAAQLQAIVKTRGPVAAQRARANLSSLFGWACREGLVESNVVINTNDPGIKSSRDRVLGPDELKQIWHACEDCGSYGDIVRLLILTAQRRNEIGDARWSEIDFEKATLTIPAARVKNRREHIVPLAPLALGIFERLRRQRDDQDIDRVFDTLSWSHNKELLDSKVAVAGKQLAPWVLHDLRRSAVTHMAEIGVLPHTIEAVVNHVGHRSGIAGIYNKASYEREKRKAVELWGEFVSALVEGREQKVVPLHRA